MDKEIIAICKRLDKQQATIDSIQDSLKKIKQNMQVKPVKVKQKLFEPVKVKQKPVKVKQKLFEPLTNNIPEFYDYRLIIGLSILTLILFIIWGLMILN